MQYVISDIHGHYDLLIELLRKINFKTTDKLYILGDMIDRGDKPLEVVQYIMKQHNMHIITGNHEQLMIHVLNEPENEKALALWYRNGGEVTYNQYKQLDDKQQIEIKDYLEKLPLYIELEDYLLVHAGIRVKEPGKTWNDIKIDQTKRDLIWIRDEFIHFPTALDKKIIFGHTQTFKMGECGTIWFDKDKIGIDCGVYSKDKGGRLGCLNLETLETYYVS